MVSFYPARPAAAFDSSRGFPASDGSLRVGPANNTADGRLLPTHRIAAVLLCAFFLILIPAGRADSNLSDDLIAATENEGKAVARVLYDYNLKLIEIEKKGIDLNDGTMLGGKYRYDLNQIQSSLESNFVQLQSRVRDFTGTLEGSRDKAESIAIYWHREMFGFGTIEELDEQLATRRTIAWIVVACVCLALGSIARRIGKPEANQTPIEVPADLTTVRVPGMQYRVYLVTGLVMDKEMWDEIKTTTTYFQGSYGQHTGETRTESVRKGKVHLLTHDGKEDVLNLVGYGHDYRPGNIVTYLFYGRGKKRNAVVVYNHATQKTEEQNGLDHAHGSLWKLNLIVTGVVAYLTLDWASAPMQRLGYGSSTWILIQSVGLALILTAAVHFLTRWRRNRRFRKKYEPRLRRFLQDGDADIQKAFQRLIGDASS